MKQAQFAATLSLALVGSASLLNTTAIAAPNWSGAYFGAFIGIGSPSSDWSGYDDDVSAEPQNVSVSLDDSGYLAGGFLGYNWQSGRWVYGGEIDVAGLDSTEQIYLDGAEGLDLTSDMDAIGSLRARIGYTCEDYLLFVSGGLAWINASHVWDDGTFYEPGNDWDGDPVTIEPDTGWVIGGGAEMATSDRVTLRVEFYYYDFGSTSGTVDQDNGEIDTFKVDQSATAFRFGLGYAL